jgi:uncharacterized protein (DUF697 family)
MSKIKAEEAKVEEAQTETTTVTETQPAERDKQVKDAIKKYTLLAIIPGAVPIPLLDLAAISALQLKMLHSLSNVYGVPFSGYWGKSSIAALAGTATTGGMYPVVASLVKMVPVVGHYAGAVSMSTMAAASTYAVGQVFSRHFASGGTFLTFDAEKSKAHFEKMVEEYKAKPVTAQAA